MNRRTWFIAGLLLAIAIMALLTGCETIGFLSERHRPVAVPAHDPNDINNMITRYEHGIIYCPGDGIFHPCIVLTKDDSEYARRI